MNYSYFIKKGWFFNCLTFVSHPHSGWFFVSETSPPQLAKALNESHDFKGGLAGLETLDNDKGQEAFKNIKTEIKIAKELKNADSSLDNKDVDAAKKSLEKVDSLTTDNSFDKAIEWLKEDVTNYEKALKEIKEAKSDDINEILDKYKFKHSALKVKLSEGKGETKSDNSSHQFLTTKIYLE